MFKPANGLNISDLPEMIKAFRHARGLSQHDLAILCGKSRRTVTTWETTGPGKSNEALVFLAVSFLNNILPKTH